MKQRHERAAIAPHHRVVEHGVPRPARVVVGELPLRELHQVVPAAETLAAAGEQQRVDLRIEIRLLDVAHELGNQLPVDPVATLRAVQGQTRDPVRDLVVDRGHAGSARSMIAPASTPPGSVPYTRPDSPARRETQNASATAGVECRTSSDAWSATARSSTTRRAWN